MMVQNAKDLAAFQNDMESKGRFMFGVGRSLKLNFLSSQLPFPPLCHAFSTLTQILRSLLDSPEFVLFVNRESKLSQMCLGRPNTASEALTLRELRAQWCLSSSKWNF